MEVAKLKKQVNRCKKNTRFHSRSESWLGWVTRGNSRLCTKRSRKSSPNPCNTAEDIAGFVHLRNRPAFACACFVVTCQFDLNQAWLKYAAVGKTNT
jgi:hypothetical protein